MTLHLYFARKFFWTFLVVFAVMFMLMTLIDLVEEVQDFGHLPFSQVLEVVLLNAPQNNNQILPLILILSTAALFVRLARSSELVVVRASGRSAVRALLAPTAVAAAIGVFGLIVINPIVAATAKRHNDLINTYKGRGENVLAIASDGLWLRQGTNDVQTVIHAARASSDVSTLYDATFIDFGQDGMPLRRLSSARAQLGDGTWTLSDVKTWSLDRENPESAAGHLDQLSVASPLTKEGIVDSFGMPKYIPIWDLPSFIGQLEEAGFSARRYAMWFQMELARPLFLVSLVLAASAFTMQHARLSRTGVSVLSSVLLGFGLYYIRNFAQIMGENGQLPIWLAAWAPPVAALLFALGLILQKEDG